MKMFKIVSLLIMVLLLNNDFVFSQTQTTQVDLSKLNLRMDEYRFQYNCLEEALKAHPDSVVELYINQKWCYDDLSSFPTSILRFKNLRVLIIRHPIKAIPKEIVELQKLQVLIVWVGDIKKLPENIGDLKSLRHLDLSDSYLDKLPQSFSNLENLEELDLSDNQFKQIPFLLKDLKKLKWVHFNRNPLNQGQKQKDEMKNKG